MLFYGNQAALELAMICLNFHSSQIFDLIFRKIKIFYANACTLSLYFDWAIKVSQFRPDFMHRDPVTYMEHIRRFDKSLR